MQGYCNSESRWRTCPWAARAQPPGTSWCWVGGKDNSQDEGRSQEKPIQACHGDSQSSVDGGDNGRTLSKRAKTSEPCQTGELHATKSAPIRSRVWTSSWARTIYSRDSCVEMSR